MSELSEEDLKLVTLARASRARNRSAEGAAVRDLDGRTYAAATVELPSLRLTALQTAVAMAVSSGARGLEAAAVVGESGAAQLDAVRDLAGSGVPVYGAGSDGEVRDVVTT
jgi:cytidine deaminase